MKQITALLVLLFFMPPLAHTETDIYQSCSETSVSVEPKVRQQPLKTSKCEAFCKTCKLTAGWQTTNRVIEQVNHLLAPDLAYSVTGLMNQGWGIGVSYEEKIFRFLSVKGTFGHMTFLTGIEDVYCTSVNISLFVNYYPFGNGLDKLYIGVGNGCDSFRRVEKVPSDAEDILIFITPRIGWKFIPGKYFMIDVSAGYKFFVVDAYNYSEIKRYTDAGPQFGLGFKIFFRKKEEN
jgi:hypothetical protein